MVVPEPHAYASGLRKIITVDGFRDNLNRNTGIYRIMRAGAWVVALPLWCGLCSAADISIDHIEFVQVAQDRDNHVPLVAGKSTVVRVFLTSSGNNSQDVTSGIAGTLTANGFPETLKPFGDLPPVAPA